ncbi:MAG: ATP-dependent Clp protease proteolytic subunit [Trueperaceae bacterium]
MPLIPYVIEQTGRGERTYDVYSRLLKERIIFLGSPIDSEVANVVTAQLLLLDSQSNEQPINLFINSPGGEVYAGLAIYDVMQYISAPVHTNCVGVAMSMASVILMAGTPGHRVALPHSRIMIHAGSAGFPRSSLPDLEVQAREFLDIREMMESIYHRHTGHDRDKLRHDMERDNFMSPEQARSYGIIDRVVEPRAVHRFDPPGRGGGEPGAAGADAGGDTGNGGGTGGGNGGGNGGPGRQGGANGGPKS